MTEPKANFFSWSSRYSVGIDQIDNEHQQLIVLLNRLANRIVFQSRLSEIDAAFDELISYTEYHCNNEQRLWNSNLPEGELTSRHVKEHNYLISTIYELKADFRDFPREQRIELSLEMLGEWLITHILKGDLYLAKIIAEMQLGAYFDDARSIAKESIEGEAQRLLEVTLSAYRTVSETAQHLMGVRFQLEESESRLQQALSYAKIGHWELQYQGDRAYWSEQVYQIFGVSPDVLAGPDALYQIMDESHHDAFKSSLMTSMNNGSEHCICYRITRPSDGKRRWIDCRGKVVYKSNGEPEKITGFIQDVTEYKELEEQNRKLAITDPLTGALNRRGFGERISVEYSAYTRYGTPLTMMILDLDNFKRINDRFGHQFGDEVLRHFSEVCQRLLRESDIFCRLGGEEFAVVLRNTSIEKGLYVAERIREKVESEVVNHNNSELQYTVSIGISELKPADINFEDLMQRADDALYEAKALSKNRVEYLL